MKKYRSVLVVDDNLPPDEPRGRTFLGTVCESLAKPVLKLVCSLVQNGMRVFCARDLESAHELIKSEKPDCIVLDLVKDQNFRDAEFAEVLAFVEGIDEETKPDVYVMSGYLPSLTADVTNEIMEKSIAQYAPDEWRELCETVLQRRLGPPHGTHPTATTGAPENPEP